MRMNSRSSPASSLRNPRSVTSLPSRNVITDSGTPAGDDNVVTPVSGLKPVAPAGWPKTVFLDVRMAETSPLPVEQAWIAGATRL